MAGEAIEEGDKSPLEENDEPLDLAGCLRRTAESDKAIVGELLQIIGEVEKSQRGCNIAKTTGTSVSAAGVALSITGLFLAPITAGISLGLTFGGIAASVAGGATNTGTEIAKGRIMKRVGERVATLLATRQALQEKYAEKANELSLALASLEDEEKRGGKAAVMKILKQSGAVVSNSMNAKRLLDLATVSKTLVDSTRVIGSSAAVGKAAADMTAAELGTLSAIAAPTGLHVGTQVGQNLLIGATAFLGIAFVAVDAALLVKDWTKEPEIITKIQRQIDVLIEEICICKEKIAELENLFGPHDEDEESTLEKGDGDPDPDSEEFQNCLMYI